MSACGKPLGPMGFNCPDPVCKKPEGHPGVCAWWADTPIVLDLAGYMAKKR